jgi:hypothetical protein
MPARPWSWGRGRAAGFLPMTAATLLAIAVTAIRWLIQSRIR